MKVPVSLQWIYGKRLSIGNDLVTNCIIQMVHLGTPELENQKG